MNAKKKHIGIHNNESYLIQKIWGCLADVMQFERYSMLAGSNEVRTSNYLSEKEYKDFIKEVEDTFKIKVKVRRGLSFKRIVTDIKRQVRNECK